MPGGFDADGGRSGTKKQQKAYDAAVEAGKSAFYKDVAKGGVKGTPLDPTETNLQFKYDKAQSDFGGRIARKASAKEMGQIAYDKYKISDIEDVAYFEPYYLKDFVAGKKKAN